MNSFSALPTVADLAVLFSPLTLIPPDRRRQGTRMRLWPALLLTVLIFARTGTVRAEEGMVMLDIGRGDARLPVYVMPAAAAAQGTAILLPGGDAGTGRIVDGRPSSTNFLVRTRGEFHAAGFNVMVVFRASDAAELDFGDRIGDRHMAELATAVDHARATFSKPVWLVGTSRGTVSATAAALALGDSRVQGLVLTSSITSKRPGAITSQNVAALKIPVLVVHHRNDACPICVPDEARRIPAALASAPAKRFVMVEGGAGAEGDPCGPRHWHGYINFERETVRIITDWMRNPQS
jgi:pimeloyl-ACP methyl ester carboxylesterase